MGIIEEGQEVMKEFKGAPALDAGLLAAAQAVEHYDRANWHWRELHIRIRKVSV